MIPRVIYPKTEKLHSDDLLQMKWDSLLLKGWYNETRMGNLMDMYRADHPESDLWLLRRFPRKWELNISARVFVARYIPKLSEKLWNEDKDIQFWLMMHGDSCNRQAGPKDLWAMRVDEKERRQAQSNVKKSAKENDKVESLYSSHRRSDQWNVVK
jgi:hypothetical protein